MSIQQKLREKLVILFYGIVEKNRKLSYVQVCKSAASLVMAIIAI